jgi:peroxiredoxin
MRWLVFVCVPCLLLCTGCMMPDHAKQVAGNELRLKQAGISALEPGQTAPELANTLDARTGASVTLASLLEGHRLGIVLLFIPALDTPNSLHHLHAWAKRLPELESKGLGFCAVFPGSAEAVKGWGAAEGVELQLLADPDGATAHAYGCLATGESFPQRTTVGVTAERGITLFFRGSATMKEVDQAFGLKPPPAK